MAPFAVFLNRPRLTWVLPGEIAALPLPSPRDLPRLRRMGVTMLVSVVSTPFRPDDIARARLKYLHLPVMYLQAPHPEQTRTFIDAVEAELAAGGKVAVHCVGGIGRTGTVIACYLVEQGLSAHEALRFVRSARPGSVESAEQELAVIAWEGRRAACETAPGPTGVELDVEVSQQTAESAAVWTVDEREIAMTRVSQAGYLKWHRDGSGVDVRVLSTSAGECPKVEQLKAALADLSIENGIAVTLTETLGMSGEAWVSTTCEPGAQGELLVTAGRIVNLLVSAGVYEEVLLSSE